jgi:hypothetical protein
MYSTQVSGSLPRFSAALRSAFCTVALMAVSPTVGLADVATQTAQRCIVQTKAPGNYFISEAPGVPHVLPGQGGSAAGAANVNDCLNDAYGVQFGSPTGQVTATRASAPIGGQAATSCSVDCSRILNRSPGRAAAYSLGSSIVAGAIGASVQAGVYQRNLNNCLAQRAAPRVDPNAAVFTGCSRQHGVLSGGTSLCVSQ